MLINFMANNEIPTSPLCSRFVFLPREVIYYRMITGNLHIADG